MAQGTHTLKIDVDVEDALRKIAEVDEALQKVVRAARVSREEIAVMAQKAKARAEEVEDG